MFMDLSNRQHAEEWLHNKRLQRDDHGSPRLVLIIFLCLLFLLSNFSVKAQLPAYYVYLIKGGAHVRKSDGKLNKILPHDLLYKDDVLFLKPRAELTLVDKSNNFVVLTVAKNYRVDSLSRLNNRKSQNITKKYLQLVWDELLNPTTDYEVFKTANLAKVSGGVSRGRSKCNNLVFPRDRMKISEDSIPFKWLHSGDTMQYDLKISGPRGQKLELPVTDTVYILSSSTLDGPGTYCWLVKGHHSISGASDSSACENKAPICFQIITKEKEASMFSSLLPRPRKTDLRTHLSLINNLEENGLVFSAIHTYENLVKGNPADQALLKSYVSFLIKYGFDEKAASAWKGLK
jgi:hypothetical protein